MNIEEAKPHMIAQVAKFIRAEMKNICSFAHNSILRGQHDQIKSFNWDSILAELEQNMPTFILLLRHLMPKADGKFLSFIVAMILKRRCKHMSLVQRVISVMLYGNAAQKEVGVFDIKNNYFILPTFQVYKCLQPYMICMSSSVTTTIVDKIAEDYDAEVKVYRDQLISKLQEV